MSLLSRQLPRSTLLTLLRMQGHQPWIDPAMRVCIPLDEHHRWQVINVPAPRNLHHPRHFTPYQRLHPRLRLILVINLGPRIPRPQPIRLMVLVRHGMVILDPIAQHQLRALRARLPPGGDAAPRRLPAEVREQLPCLIKDVALLFQGHVGGILVAVAVQADLVAGVADQGAFFREGLEGVARDEPGGFDGILVEELEEATRALVPGPEAPADVACAVLAAVGAEPAGDGVDVDSVAGCGDLMLAVNDNCNASRRVKSLPDQDLLLAHCVDCTLNGDVAFNV